MTNGYARARRALKAREDKALRLIATDGVLVPTVLRGVGYGRNPGGMVRIDALHSLERRNMVIRQAAGFYLTTTGEARAADLLLGDRIAAEQEGFHE